MVFVNFDCRHWPLSRFYQKVELMLLILLLATLHAHTSMRCIESYLSIKVRVAIRHSQFASAKIMKHCWSSRFMLKYRVVHVSSNSLKETATHIVKMVGESSDSMRQLVLWRSSPTGNWTPDAPDGTAWQGRVIPLHHRRQSFARP